MKNKLEILVKQLDHLNEKLNELLEEICSYQIEYLLTHIDKQKSLIHEQEVRRAFKILEEV
jgi:hypothetical protein